VASAGQSWDRKNKKEEQMESRTKHHYKIFCFIALSSLLTNTPQAQQKPMTVAESSDYTATSRYADVMEFIRQLQSQSPLIRVETLCTSTEGRDVPLIIIGNPVPSSPMALKSEKKLVVYFQANIHAGEVEGKEASLMLARDILLNSKPPYLDKLVILIAPIFNADGNEKISPDNRPDQAGPEKGVGVRPNGQNLDLNRDSMKLESPELQGLVQNVLMRWDPALLVDCHTTDGSYHEEPVTFCWGLNPDGDASIVKYQREKMLPDIIKALKEKYNTLSIFYGDFSDFRNPEKGWEAYSHQPRFMTNYITLRNRLAILNENYNHADFKTRVLGCYSLLFALLDYCNSHSEEISYLVAEADRKTIQKGFNPAAQETFGVEFELKPLPEKVTVQGWEMEVIPREGTWPEIKKTDKKRTYIIPYFADYLLKRSVPFPYAYLLPDADSEVIKKLLQHGLILEKLAQTTALEVESFRLKEVKASDRLFQGHRTNEVKGEYSVEQREFPAGTIVVMTAQPLGNLVAYLLEPESDDGLLVWNFFDRYLVPQWGRELGIYPVYKLLKPTNLAKEILR
jgi:hypothetical protein